MIYVLGAPSLMASATELVIAFVMGLGGSLKYAMHGLVDIRLAMIILAGSLFGIQLGAIGTTYVKPFMIKVVMGLIMVIVLFSRGLMVPVYLAQLGLIDKLGDGTVSLLKNTSFAIMIFALLLGAFIVLRAMWKGRQAERLAACLGGTGAWGSIERSLSLSTVRNPAGMLFIRRSSWPTRRSAG